MLKKGCAVLLCLLIALAVIWLSGINQYLKFDELIKNREVILSYVERHYVLSVFFFFLIYMSTAFFIPGTLVMTVAGGFLFGFIAGTVYSVLGGSLGATLAFLTSRYVIGFWIQKKFAAQLSGFNREIVRHGYNYLLVFRIIPLMPFFVVNYLAGITRIKTKTFIWTTIVGMLPGSLVCTFAGRQLSEIKSPEEIFSPPVIISLILLAFLILIPPVVHHLGRLRNSLS